MEGMEKSIFQIISSIGAAKGKYMEALQESKKGNYDYYNKLIEEGNEFLSEGHKIHANFVQKEASGEKTELSLLLIHAEDQIMSAETIKILVTENAEIYENINKLLN